MTSTAKSNRPSGTAFASRLLLEGMIRGIREGVVTVDQNLEVLAANPAAWALLGSTELASHNLAEIIPHDGVAHVFRRALENGEQAETKVELRVGNDSRVYDLRVAPLSFTERREESLAIGIFYDITRIERLEKVRQEFLSNVSHELRTPLTSILAFVETLENGALEDPDNNRRFLSVIRRNAERMHHLIDDILELSAIEAGKITVTPKQVLLRPLVEDVWSSVAKKAQKRNITLRNGVAHSSRVFADPRRLEQILINLLGNAIKFNRENGTVVVEYELDNKEHRIRVSDSGDGIAPQHLPRIFERFYRTDPARSRELGGTGLGLAIVKHLVRLHGGEVSVESAIGRGSVFTVRLPAVVA